MVGGLTINPKLARGAVIIKNHISLALDSILEVVKIEVIKSRSGQWSVRDFIFRESHERAGLLQVLFFKKNYFPHCMGISDMFWWSLIDGGRGVF